MRVTLTGGARSVGRVTQPANLTTGGATRATGGPMGANRSARAENLDPHLSLFFAGGMVAQSL